MCNMHILILYMEKVVFIHVLRSILSWISSAIAGQSFLSSFVVFLYGIFHPFINLKQLLNLRMLIVSIQSS